MDHSFFGCATYNLIVIPQPKQAQGKSYIYIKINKQIRPLIVNFMFQIPARNVMSHHLNLVIIMSFHHHFISHINVCMEVINELAYTARHRERKARWAEDQPRCQEKRL